MPNPEDEDYAVVIGIRDYADAQLFPDLDAAEGDALEFAKWLRDPNGGGLPPGNVKVVVSSDVPPPSGKKGVYPFKDHVDDALREIIGGHEPGRIGRRLYFYFSGHGCAPSAETTALLLANSAKDVLGRNIGTHPYKNHLMECRYFDEMVFILDCCRSPIPSAPISGPPFSKSANHPHPQWANVKALVVYGTGLGQSSFAPDAPTERSFFTKHLLDGLRGAAADANGSITPASLARYVRPKVSAEATLFGKAQVPEIPIEPEIIFRRGTPNQRLITFRIPPEWTQPVEVQDGTFQPLRTSTAQAQSFQAILAPGLYQIAYPAGRPSNDESVKRQLLRINPAASGARVELDPTKDLYNV